MVAIIFLHKWLIHVCYMSYNIEKAAAVADIRSK